MSGSGVLIVEHPAGAIDLWNTEALPGHNVTSQSEGNGVAGVVQAYTEAELNAVLLAQKDAGNHQTTWSRAPTPKGNLLSASLHFALSVGEIDLLVMAEWKGPADQQILLKFSRTSSPNLARLCMCGGHAQAHWHYLQYFRDIPERTAQIASPPALSPYAIDALLLEFVKEMQVVNFIHPGELAV